jgi:16S rRNA (uracil1498-N3)-methyltransferase
MHRFYLPPTQCQGPTLFLTGAEAHHGTRVLRLQRKDKVTVVNGTGGEFLCEVEASDRDKVKLAVIEGRTAPPRLCRITLLVGIPKGKIIESIIQKATELGASRIVPLITERVVVKLDAREGARKAAKWQQIAIEAIKQCGSPWLPFVEAPATPKGLLERNESFDLPLVASLQPGSKHAREFFDEFRFKHKRQPDSVCIWIGPEGDLTETETAAMRAAGALPITLGSLVLRVETAAIYCLAVVNHEVSASSNKL